MSEPPHLDEKDQCIRELEARVAALEAQVESQTSLTTDDCDGFLKTLISLLPGYVHLYDANQRLITFEGMRVGLLGYTQAEVDAMADNVLGTLGHPDDIAGIIAGYRAFLADKTSPPTTIEFRAKHKDGTWRWLRARAMHFDGTVNDKRVASIALLTDVTDEVQTANALTDSENRYRALTENSPYRVTTVDHEHRLAYTNEVPPGYTLEAIRGVSMYDFVQPQDADTIRAVLRDTFEYQTQGDYELYVESVDRWFSSRTVPVINPETNDVDEVVIVSLDVTERKRAEKALRESEKRYRAVVEQSPDNIAVIDRDYHLLYVNNVGDGKTLADYVGKKVTDTVPPHASAQIAEHIDRAFETGKLQHYEVPGRLQDGSYGWYADRVVPMRDGDDITAVMLIATDITRRKKAEDALAERERLLRLMTENIGETMILYDLEGYIQYTSRSARDLTRFGGEASIGKHGTDLAPQFHPDDRAQALARFEQLLDGESGETAQYRIRTDSGDYIWLENNFTRVYDDDGEHIGYVSIGRDVTEKRQMQDTLAERERLLSLVTQNISETIFLYDVDGYIRYSSRSAINLAQAEGPTLVGTHGLDLLARVHPDDRDWVESRFRKMTEAGETNTRTFRVMQDDNTYIWLESTYTEAYDVQGEHIGYVSIGRDVTEKHEMSETLRERERLLSLITENTREVIFYYDRDGIVLFVSPSVEDISGLAVDEIVGKHIMEYVKIVDLGNIDPAKQALNMMINSGDFPPVTTLHTTHPITGNITVHEARASIVRAPDGSIEGIIVVQHDVTERHRAEEALRASEEQLRLVTENMTEAIFYYDISGVIQYVSAAVEPMFGLPTETVIGKTGADFLDMVHPEDREQVEQRLQSRVEGGAPPRSVEYRARHADGHYVWVESRGTNVTDDIGTHKGSVIVQRDVTDRKRIEDALRLSEQRLRLITDNMGDVVILYNMNREVQFVNPAFEHLTGYSPAELYKRNFIPYVHPEESERVYAIWDSLFDGNSMTNEEFRIVRKDGTVRWVSSSWQPSLDENGVQVGTQGRDTDITRRKMAEQEALENALEKERRQILSQFIEDSAHEFGQPLSSINIAVDLLRRKVANLDETASYLDRIGTQSSQLQQLLNAMLLMTRLETMALEREPVRLSDVFDAIETRLHDQLAGITLTVETEVETLPADLDLLTRALFNVVDNAVRYTDPGGSVTVSTTGEGDDVLITVRDTGIGMDAAVREQAFETFYRKDVARSTRGFGLGLPIAQRIVQRHGGEVTIESEPGVGTSVTLCFPAVG